MNQLFSLSLIAGVVLGLTGYFISPFLISLLVHDPGVAREATRYMEVILLGLPTMLIPGLFYFAFSASGDTVTPLIVNAIGIALNMALDPLLVLGMEEGAPLRPGGDTPAA